MVYYSGKFNTNVGKEDLMGSQDGLGEFLPLYVDDFTQMEKLEGQMFNKIIRLCKRTTTFHQLQY